MFGVLIFPKRQAVFLQGFDMLVDGNLSVRGALM